MKNLLFIFCVLLTGCEGTKEANMLFASLEETEKLRVSCEEIAQIGSVQDLLAEIHSQTNDVISLLQEKNLDRVKQEVHLRAKLIKENEDRVRALLQPKYTEGKFQQTLVWKISSEDYRRFLPLFGSWQLKQVLPMEVFDEQSLMKEVNKPSEDLLSNTVGFVDADLAVVRLKRMASALEICQLQQNVLVHAVLYFENSDKQKRKVDFKLLASAWEDR